MASDKREQAIQRGKAKADKNGKDRSAKGNKDKKGKAGPGDGASVAGHPRAAQAVRRAKGFGGLAAFALTALISREAGISHEQMLERALIAGVAGYLLMWALAVAVWRNVVQAELRARVEQQAARVPAKRTISLAGPAKTEAEAAEGVPAGS